MQCAPPHSGCMHVRLQVSGYACLFGGEGGCWHSVCTLVWLWVRSEFDCVIMWHLAVQLAQATMHASTDTCAIDLFPLLLFMKCATMQNKVSF